MEGKFEYFISQADKRFDKLDERFDLIDEKIDALISFRWMLIGASMTVSGIAAIVVTLITLAFKQ